MVIGEVYISNSMISDGVDAMREARVMCLTDAEAVWEIYLAMAGRALMAAHDGEETVQ